MKILHQWTNFHLFLLNNMDNQGWIKIHRKILDNPIFSSEKGFRVWIWCLIKAGHQERDIYLGKEKIHLQPGEFVFGRGSASEQLGMKESTIRNWMDTLKNDRYLDIKPTNKYSLVKIKNWDMYQGNGQQNENKMKTNEKQMDTNKNEKKEKNEKKVNTKFIPPSLVEAFLYIVEEGYPVNAFAWMNHYEANGWVQSKGKPIQSWKGAVRTWLKYPLENERLVYEPMKYIIEGYLPKDKTTWKDHERRMLKGVDIVKVYSDLQVYLYNDELPPAEGFLNLFKNKSFIQYLADNPYDNSQ